MSERNIYRANNHGFCLGGSVQAKLYGGIVAAFWRILANRDLQNLKPGPL